MKLKSFITLYIILCVIDLVTMTYYPLARMVAKPLIVSSLLTYYIAQLPKHHSLMITGLVFAIIGDVALLFETELFFKLGLGAFLIMQLCYIGYLNQFKESNLSYTQKIFIGMSVILASTFFIIAWEGIQKDIIFVVPYALALLWMAITAIRFPKLKQQISIIGIGAFLFLVSDLLIAVHKYAFDIPYHRYLIMITYMVAQYLIITGITKDAKSYFDLRTKKK